MDGTAILRGIPMRYPELGRLRLGDRSGSGRTPMRALSTWRATSKDRTVLEALASIYGGQVTEWKRDKGTEYQVYTDSDELDVMLPADPIFAAYESWAKSGVQRRCDGERCTMVVKSPDGGHMEEVDCVCAAHGWWPGVKEDVDAGACTLNLRLKVVLPRVPGVGIWLMTTSSFIAASELPAQALMLRGFAERGLMVPAQLAIEPRTLRRPEEKFDRNFNVPVLRIRESLSAIASGQVAQPAGVLAPPSTSAPALPPPPVDRATGEVGADIIGQAKQAIAGLDGPMGKEFISWRNSVGIPSAPTKWTEEDAAQIVAWFDDKEG